MIVAELIEKLREFDPETPVGVGVEAAAIIEIVELSASGKPGSLGPLALILVDREQASEK